MTAKISDQTQFALIGKDISQITKDLGELKIDVKSIREGGLITEDKLNMALAKSKQDILDELKPIRNIVYGIIGVFGLAIIGALVKLIIK